MTADISQFVNSTFGTAIRGSYSRKDEFKAPFKIGLSLQ